MKNNVSMTVQWLEKNKVKTLQQWVVKMHGNLGTYFYNYDKESKNLSDDVISAKI